MDNEWRHSLKDRMKNYEEPAPDGLWESISESSEFAQMFSGENDRQDGGIVYWNAKRVRKPGLSKSGRLWISVAGGMAAVFALFLLLWSPEHIDVKKAGQEFISEVSPVVPSTAGDVVSVITDATGDLQPVTLSDQRESKGLMQDNSTDFSTSLSSARNDKDVISDEESSPVIPAEAGIHSQEQKNVSDAGNNVREIPAKPWDEQVEIIDSQKKRAKRWSAGLLASNIPISSSSSRAGERVFPVAVKSDAPDFGTSSLADIRTFNTTRETNTSYRHYQPIKVGLSVRYNISRNWSAESGLTYSWLYSKFRSGSDKFYENGVQTLHYIGIPLNFNFNIWDNGSLTFYASAGGLMEKCVGGKLRVTSYFNGAKGGTEYDNIMVHPLQWSVSASLGLQYNISQLLGIYLEPGAAYYFNNGSSVETFYSTHPFNFNLELGLRFSF